MNYIFDEDPQLGKVVKEVKPFCKLTKKSNDITEKYIVGDYADFNRYPGLAGKKWSRLCGFTFKSVNGGIFQFVYVPKLKGTLSRNQKALSGWYCWTLTTANVDNKQVTSIADVLRTFGFSINKFVHSDLFDKYISIFKSNINFALEHQIADLLAQPQESFDDYKELVRYVNAVKDSVAKIDEVKQWVTDDNKYDDSNNPEYAKGSAPKLGNAKIAYNADKTYNLINVPKETQDKERRRQAVDAIAKKMNAAADAATDAADSTTPAKSTTKPATPKKKEYVKYDPSLKYKFGGGRTKKADSEIFDKYDDYDNDDFR